MRDALRPIAAERGTSVGAVAIAWVLARPGVTGAIVGGRSSRQVEGWIDAGTLELSVEDEAAISVTLARTAAGTGPIAGRSPIAVERG
jgi:aryl-alcohol dehydrogenase-like predicted oxidoreductase